jgi:hypothetical protein
MYQPCICRLAWCPQQRAVAGQDFQRQLRRMQLTQRTEIGILCCRCMQLSNNVKLFPAGFFPCTPGIDLSAIKTISKSCLPHSYYLPVMSHMKCLLNVKPVLSLVSSSYLLSSILHVCSNSSNFNTFISSTIVVYVQNVRNDLIAHPAPTEVYVLNYLCLQIISTFS